MPFAFGFAGFFGGISNFDNLGFEVGDEGDATGWTFIATASYQMLGTFGPSLAFDAETFTYGWDVNDYIFAFDPVTDLVAPLFDESISEGETREDFEQGWDQNQSYQFVLGSAVAGEFNTGNDLFDSFEEEWDSNENYSFAMGATVAAMFPYDLADEPVEKFEEGWRDNFNYSFVMGSTTAGAFDGGAPENFEDFEETYGPLLTVAIYASNRLGAAAHGLSNTQIVYLKPTNGALPIGLFEDTKYFVVNAATDDFQLAIVSGGSAVTFSAFGDGAVSVRKDPTRWWPVGAPGLP
jgi:hypothetical protein